MRAVVRLGGLVALAMLALACAGPPAQQAIRSGGSTDPAGAEQPGAEDDAVPDFSVTSFSGKDFTLSTQRGSPVVLNFFESW